MRELKSKKKPAGPHAKNCRCSCCCGKDNKERSSSFMTDQSYKVNGHGCSCGRANCTYQDAYNGSNKPKSKK